MPGLSSRDVQELGDCAGVDLRAGIRLVVVISVDFAEPLGLVGSGKVRLGVGVANQRVGSAVQQEDGDSNPGASILYRSEWLPASERAGMGTVRVRDLGCW